MQLRAKERQGWPAASRLWKRQEGAAPPPFGGSRETLISAFWPPEPETIDLCCFQPLNLWNLVMAALGNKHTWVLKRTTQLYWEGVQVDEGWPVRNTLQLFPKEMMGVGASGGDSGVWRGEVGNCVGGDIY